MTQSLPGQKLPVGPPPAGAKHALPTQGTRKEAIVNATSGITLRALPRIPHSVKRLLLGFRSITVDGNTLDTTLQLMLAAQHVAGIESGLVADDDIAAVEGSAGLPGWQLQTEHPGGVGDQSLDPWACRTDPGTALPPG